MIMTSSLYVFLTKAAKKSPFSRGPLEAKIANFWILSSPIGSFRVNLLIPEEKNRAIYRYSREISRAKWWKVTFAPTRTAHISPKSTTLDPRFSIEAELRPELSKYAKKKFCTFFRKFSRFRDFHILCTRYRLWNRTWKNLNIHLKGRKITSFDPSDYWHGPYAIWKDDICCVFLKENRPNKR